MSDQITESSSGLNKRTRTVSSTDSLDVRLDALSLDDDTYVKRVRSQLTLERTEQPVIVPGDDDDDWGHFVAEDDVPVPNQRPQR